MINYIKQESVLIQGLIQAGLGLGVAFGLHLTSVQIASILAVSSAVLSVVTRQIVQTNTVALVKQAMVRK